tara:strand:+ start:1170 stop:1877 length:708 start_codon:yes stop_codon:yes gene_type:complete
MSLQKYFFKNKITYKLYLFYNLYIRHKCFINRPQYSQWGEDLFIADYFKKKKNGTYFDIGCFHPIMYSNTCLLYNKGWRGVNLDINPTSIDLFNIIRPDDFNLCTTIDKKNIEFRVYFDHPLSPVNTLDKEYYNNSKKMFFKDSLIQSVKSKSIDEILKLSGVNKVDFLNIDVEGMDLKILSQLIPSKLQPQLISVETHNVDGSKSDECDKIHELLKNCGYTCYKRVGPSTLYIN